MRWGRRWKTRRGGRGFTGRIAAEENLDVGCQVSDSQEVALLGLNPCMCEVSDVRGGRRGVSGWLCAVVRVWADKEVSIQCAPEGRTESCLNWT